MHFCIHAHWKVIKWHWCFVVCSEVWRKFGCGAFQGALVPVGNKYPLSLIWGKWFCYFCLYLLWIAKFLGNTLNSFSNSKDMSHQVECRVQPDLGGVMETHSPLAFLRELPAGKQQRRCGAGQCSVDLTRGTILKMSLEAEFGSDEDLVPLENKKFAQR